MITKNDVEYLYCHARIAAEAALDINRLSRDSHATNLLVDARRLLASVETYMETLPNDPQTEE